MTKKTFLIFMAIFLFETNAFAGDKTIMIHETPDYEIVSSSEEINGDPVTGSKNAYASWKTACTQWKQEIKNLNRDNLISVNCGTGKTTNEAGTDTYITKSTGTYKARVRIKESTAASKP